ncbi:MAG TPA: ABC transporter permease, partial [Lachnospiraceae bacterium]|nr:ABC transporter permease [Lachnospiraceae bacterium]
VYYGFTDENHRFTLDNLSRITDPVTLKALLLSLLLSALATAVCLIMAYPLAMILSRMKSGASAIITTIFIIPMWMNSLLRIFAWQTLLERNGVINQLLAFLHLPPQHLINTPAAIALGMIYDYLPFMLLPIYNSLTKLDWNVVNAAYDLGANGRQTFFRVIVPLTMPGIVSGITMVFVPALTTFVISDFLGGSKVLLIGNIIDQQFTQVGNWNAGSGLSLVLMVFILVSMAVMQHFDTDEEAAGSIL